MGERRSSSQWLAGERSWLVQAAFAEPCSGRRSESARGVSILHFTCIGFRASNPFACLRGKSIYFEYIVATHVFYARGGGGGLQESSGSNQANVKGHGFLEMYGTPCLQRGETRGTDRGWKVTDWFDFIRLGTPREGTN